MDVFRYIQTACTLYRFILKAFSTCIEICVIIIVSPSGCAYKMVCTFTVIPQKFPVHCLSAFTLWTLSGFCLSKLKKPGLLSTHSMAMSLALVLWDSELRDCHHIMKCVPLEGLVLVWYSGLVRRLPSPSFVYHLFCNKSAYQFETHMRTFCVTDTFACSRHIFCMAACGVEMYWWLVTRPW